MGVVKEAWRPQYPFVSRHLDLGGYGMHYLDEGEGPTVLLVHGNPSWSFYFRGLVQALRATNRCVVPDHVGMGLSDRPGDDRYRYTLKSRVDDLDTLMERAAPKGPVTLVLHDWGGMIGMSWAARHPERIKAIAALNTSCFRLPEGKALPAGLKLLRGGLGGLALRGSALARRLVLDSCTAKPLPAEAAAAYLEPCDGWARGRAFHRFVQDIPLSPRDPAWSVVAETESKLSAFKDVPMLLAWGMKDWVFDQAFLDGWIRRFPKAEVRRFPDSGHFLLEDSPEAAAAIAEFAARS